MLDVARLPVTWASIPAGRASVQAGSDWLRSLSSALLEVPSVIVPEESAVVVNPMHPEARQLTAKSIRLFEYNRLFRGA